MKSEIIDFIPEDYSLIHSLFKGDLIDARRYWYQNYDDRYFEAISEVVDHVSKEESAKTFGKNVIMPLCFQYKQFLSFHKANKSEIEEILTSKDIPLHHQMDFYLVEFFRNLNEAYKIYLKTSATKKSDFISVIEDLSCYMKAASDCFNLWCGNEIIKKGQVMGKEHVENKERARRSKGGKNKTVQFLDAKELVIKLISYGKSVSNVARILRTTHDKDERFKIPGNNGQNIESLEKAIRRWIKK